MGDTDYFDGCFCPYDRYVIHFRRCYANCGLDFSRIFRLIALYVCTHCSRRAETDDVYQCCRSYPEYHRKSHLHSDVFVHWLCLGHARNAGIVADSDVVGGERKKWQSREIIIRNSSIQEYD